MDSLLVVWELFTDDYGWFKHFYPAVRIAEVCKDRGIPLRFLFARDIIPYLAALRSGREPVNLPGYCPGESPDESTLSRESEYRAALPCRALIRGMTNPDLIEALETAGIPCVNGSRATRTANDKLETARLAASLGIPAPFTLDAEEGLKLLQDRSANMLAEEKLSLPLIVKPRFGSRGRGVELVETAEEAEAAVRKLETRGNRKAERSSESTVRSLEVKEDRREGFGPAVFQEYVASSRGRDLRVFFSQDRIIAAAERKNPDGGLVSNAAEGGLMVPAELPAPAERWEEAVFALGKKTGLVYGSADFLYAPDGSLILCEINAAPGFEALEEACGVDAAGAVIDAVMAD